MKQFVEEILWGIIENFYRALALFKEEYHRYDTRLKGICQQKNIDGANLAEVLTIEEVMSLMSSDEKLLELKENYLEPLLKLALQFHDAASYHANFFEHYIRDIYYELSILQSQVARLKASVPEYMELRDEEEYKTILSEVNIFFPLKMFHLSHLFKKAKNELEKIVSYHKESKILVRSFFLFGEEIIGPLYEMGFAEFIKKIYRPDHLVELCTRAAYSFHSSGFSALARQASGKAEELLQNNKQYQLFPQWQEKLKALRNAMENTATRSELNEDPTTPL